MSPRELKADAVLNGHSGSYRVVKPLGLAGATSQVFLVRREDDGEDFALKVRHPGLSGLTAERFDFEMRMLQRLRDAEERYGIRHIPRIIECSDLLEEATQQLTAELGRPFILMDLAPGRDLKSLLAELGSLPEEEAVEIAHQFAEVLFLVHSTQHTYKDMKIENLVWDAPRRSLMVIDWNVLEEGLRPASAERDRLRAAAYLYRMATGQSLRIVEHRGALQIDDQRYRKSAVFEELAAGTRHFLLKAFHRDPQQRHGGEVADPLAATREFRDELKENSKRFQLSPEALLERGEEAYRFRQWQLMVEELEVAERKIEDPAETELYPHLQELLGRARDEVAKIGRSDFHSGMGRYRNQLYAEALHDFEQALLADPYDDEARLFAIVTRLAIRLGAEEFEPVAPELEVGIRAILADNPELARGSFVPLAEQQGEAEELRSFLAEIEVRAAVATGRLRLAEGALEEAEACFRQAYDRRQELLYVEQLEESLGQLRRLFSQVEQLKALDSRSRSYLKQGKFREATAELWLARELAEGRGVFDAKFRHAAALATVQEAMRKQDYQQAVEKSEWARSLNPGDPYLEPLWAEARRLRVEELRRLAAESRGKLEPLEARKYLQEALALDPDDRIVRESLGEVEKDLAQGYREELPGLDSQLEGEFRSHETCWEIISKVRENRWDTFEEGQELVRKAEALDRQISEMDHELDRLEEQGGVDELRDFLHRVEKQRFVLRRGKPGELRRQIESRIKENRIREIEDLLKGTRFAEAKELCERRLNLEAEEGVREQIKELLARATRLLEVREQAISLASELEGLREATSGTALEILARHHALVAALSKMAVLQPELVSSGPEMSAEIQRRHLREELERHMNRLRTQTGEWIEGAECRQPQTDFEESVYETASLLVQLTDDLPKARGWHRWCRELMDLWSWLKSRELDRNGVEVAEALRGLPHLATDETLRELLTSFLGEQPLSAMDHEKLAALRTAGQDSALAAWAYAFLNERRAEDELWRALGEDLEEARKLLEPRQESPRYTSFVHALEAMKRVFDLVEEPPRAEDLSDGELRATLDQVAELLGKLEELPRLRDSRSHQELQALGEKLERARHERIARATERLSRLLLQFPDGRNDLEERIHLNHQALEAIGSLQELDPDAAGRFETEREEAIQSLLNDPAQLMDDEGRLPELQRRIIEEADDDAVQSLLKEYHQRPDWQKAVRLYRARRTNVHDELQRISRNNGSPQEQEDALLQLRLRYGEFPELRVALLKVRRQIQAERIQKSFDQQFPTGSILPERWQDDEAFLEDLNPRFLNEEQRARFEQMQKDLERMRLLSEVLSEAEMEGFLRRRTGRAKRWEEALEWAVSRRHYSDSRIEPRMVNSENLNNLKAAFSHLVEARRVEVQAIDAFQCVNELIGKLGERNPATMGMATP